MEISIIVSAHTQFLLSVADIIGLFIEEPRNRVYKNYIALEYYRPLQKKKSVSKPNDYKKLNKMEKLPINDKSKLYKIFKNT